jgi:hypothetical protein
MTPSSVGGVAKAKVDLDVAAIDPAQFLQALYQLPDQGLPFWLALREHTQKSDARHRAGLLPSRRERPRSRRAAEQGYHLASSNVGHGLLPGTRRASLPQAQHAPKAPAGPWGRPESF